MSTKQDKSLVGFHQNMALLLNISLVEAENISKKHLKLNEEISTILASQISKLWRGYLVDQAKEPDIESSILEVQAMIFNHMMTLPPKEVSFFYSALYAKHIVEDMVTNKQQRKICQKKYVTFQQNLLQLKLRAN